MKIQRGGKGWAGLLVAAALLVSGCGDYSNAQADLTDSSGNGGGATVSNFATAPSQLGVGDLMLVDLPSSVDAKVSFDGVDPSAEFMLVVGSANAVGQGSSVQLAPDISFAPVEDGPSASKAQSIEDPAASADAYTVNEIFSAWLRAAETGLDATETPAIPETASKAFKGMAVGSANSAQTETFRVLGSLSQTNSSVDVTGAVRCTRDHVVFYVDTTVGTDILSDDDVTALCDDFDATVAAEQAILGATSDVDGDGKFHVLMTKQINKLGALGGGVITGYFYAGDLYEQSSSNPVSNHQEIIYTLVPDASGAYGTPIQKDFALKNLLPAVLPHELQHAISYNQHVLVAGGAAEEEWLNEGLSHLMEDVMGHGNENPSRYSLFLASPSTGGLITQSTPNLVERGAAYLFLRYLYEQASDGNAFLGALEKTNRRGVDNLLNAFSGPADMHTFKDFMIHWTAAVAMTDRGISVDPRFTYKPRVKDAATGQWQGVCLECSADDGRGTQLSGVNVNTYFGYLQAQIDGGAAKYYSISTVPVNLTLTGAADGSDYALLIRTK